MERIEILLGFHFPEFEKELTTALYNRGYDAKVVEKHTKPQVREYVLTHRECRVAILKERDNLMSFTAEDFAVLTDENDDLIVICVLSQERRGTDYMQILYAAGITNAVIQNGREGVRPAQIAELCLRKRSRKEARKYYDIASVDIDIGMLSPEAYSVYYQSLFNEENGRTLILRYLNVASRLTAAQNEDFINRLPAEVVDELKEYEEFFVIIDGLRAHGIDMKFKRPKRLKIGMEQAPILTLSNQKETKEPLLEGYDFGEEFSSFDFGEEFLEKQEEKVGSQDKEEGDKEPEAEKNGKKRNVFVFIGILSVVLIISGILIFRPKDPEIPREVSSQHSEEISKEPISEMTSDVVEEEPVYPDVEEAMQEIIGQSVSGEMAVSLINRYPSQQFRFVDEERNKQVVYKYLTATEAEIPADSILEVTIGEGEYIFTRK